MDTSNTFFCKQPGIARVVVVLLSLCLVMLQSQSGGAATSTSVTAPILVLGDSLSAAFGIEQSQGWVNLLNQQLATLHYPQQVINASISGETTQGGIQRIPDLLKKHRPGVVIVELGANDGLRGLNLGEMRHNLQMIISQAKHARAQILLIGMRLPPNYGPQYTRDFYNTYIELAKTNQTGLVPFLLDNVATHSELMQADGLHPTAEAQPILLKNVWPHLSLLLSRS